MVKDAVIYEHRYTGKTDDFQTEYFPLDSYDWALIYIKMTCPDWELQTVTPNIQFGIPRAGGMIQATKDLEDALITKGATTGDFAAFSADGDDYRVIKEFGMWVRIAFDFSAAKTVGVDITVIILGKG